MSVQQTSPILPSVTFSPASADGPSLYAWPDGTIRDPSGRVHALASLSHRQVKAAGWTTIGISGRPGSISSDSVGLRQSLVSRLRQRLPMAGLTLFKMTWKESATPLRRSVFLLRASALRTSGTGCGGWPTPITNDALGSTHCYGKGTDENGERKRFLKLPGAALLAGWPTPMAGTPAQNGNNPAGNTDSSRKTVWLANWGTPQSRDHFPAHSDEYVAAKKAQGHGMQNLNDQAQLAAWATPTRRDYRFANRLSFKERGGGHEGRAVEQSSGAPLAGFWADADWIACRDGKARPVEPGSFPLAHGVRNRVGRLRAYGNAIVPQVAAEVIRAFMSNAT